MATLDKEFRYYLDNQEMLLKQYCGKVLVIKNQKIIGVFDDISQAVFQTQEKHELGTFLVQTCTPGDEAYTAKYYTPLVN